MDKSSSTVVMKKDQKIQIGCCIAALLILCLGITSVGGGTAAYFWPTQPVNMSVAVTAPNMVRANTDFDLLVQVTNHDSKTIKVSEIRLPDSMTALAMPLGANPSFMGFNQTTGETVCLFSQWIESGATVPFTIKMRALTDGIFSGEIKIVADSQGRSGTLKMAVVIPTTTPRAQPSATATSAPNLHPFASVVQIVAYVKTATGTLQAAWSGSGSIITSDGLILTNHHVAIGEGEPTAAELQIRTAEREDVDTNPKYLAEVVYSDKNLDLAVIRITKDLNGNRIDPATLKLPALSIGDSTKLKTTDVLYILGYPGVGGNTITLTRGIVSGFLQEADLGSGEWVKTDTMISPGNSGGAVLNEHGDLVGVPTLKIYSCPKDHPGCDAINAFRPIHLAIPIIEKATGVKVVYADATPMVSNIPTQELLYWDTFENNPAAAWDERTDENGVLELVKGMYRILSKTPNHRLMGRPHLDFQDLDIAVNVNLGAGTKDGSYGVICRYRNENNFYFFQIGSGATARIGKWKNGNASILANKDKVEALLPAPSDNVLGVSCRGNTLSLSVNGTKVLDAQDEEWSGGDISFFVDGGDTGDTEVFFDNLRIYRP
jgi:S1-C subfamily serine protease